MRQYVYVYCLHTCTYRIIIIYYNLISAVAIHECVLVLHTQFSKIWPVRINFNMDILEN